jgi:signal transduction histidine kinase
VKIAAGALLLSIVCLLASSLLWLRAVGAAAPLLGAVAAPLPDGQAALESFERETTPEREIDVAARYAGKPELLDPRLALPTWHKHARSEAVLAFAASKQCPSPPPAPLGDAALAKAFLFACGGATGEGAPYMHPSGKSYALLGRHAKNAHDMHVLELASVDGGLLDADERTLAEVPPPAWEALSRGDRVVLTPAALVVASYAPLGLARLRVYPRRAWDTFAARAHVGLVHTNASGAICARPASPELCWRTVPATERDRSALALSSVGTTVSFAALVVAYVRDRRRLHRDRIHVLRTLTHELRTPATNLRLDIEPLRAAYDDLPVSCQEPLLRISDGIARLGRVLHRSARYMALFESRGVMLVKPAEVPSVQRMFEEMSEEWPDEGVSLTADSDDGAIETDAEWLGVAVRNLVENAVRHGKAPVRVSWTLSARHLVVRVADAGETPRLSLRRAIAPHERDPKSPGLGLGLSIVDRVAHLLEGRLSHEPSPTTFELRVPRGRS